MGGVPETGWIIMENLTEMDDLGVSYFFGNHHMTIDHDNLGSPFFKEMPFLCVPFLFGDHPGFGVASSPTSSTAEFVILCDSWEAVHRGQRVSFPMEFCA